MICRNEVSDGSRGCWLVLPAGDVNWRCRNRWVTADGTSKRSKINGWCKCAEQFHKGVGCSREKGGGGGRGGRKESKLIQGLQERYGAVRRVRMGSAERKGG